MPDFSFIEDTAIREKVENAHKLEVDELTVNLKNANKVAVEDAVSGLKTKNAEILDEKKALSEAAKLFEGIDPEAAKAALEFHEKNKDAEFLKDGTIEDLIEKKTSTLKSDHEAAMTELNSKFNEATTNGTLYQNLYESKVIEDGIRAEAIKAGIRAEAIDDVLLRGRSVFSLDEHKQIEARDNEGKLAKTKDDKVLTTKNWIEGLKDSSPHYWPNSEGAGAHGGDPGNASDYTAKLKAAADKGDMVEYRRLRSAKK